MCSIIDTNAAADYRLYSRAKALDYISRAGYPPRCEAECTRMQMRFVLKRGRDLIAKTTWMSKSFTLPFYYNPPTRITRIYLFNYVEFVVCSSRESLKRHWKFVERVRKRVGRFTERSSSHAPRCDRHLDFNLRYVCCNLHFNEASKLTILCMLYFVDLIGGKLWQLPMIGGIVLTYLIDLRIKCNRI